MTIGIYRSDKLAAALLGDIDEGDLGCPGHKSAAPVFADAACTPGDEHASGLEARMRRRSQDCRWHLGHRELRKECRKGWWAAHERAARLYQTEDAAGTPEALRRLFQRCSEPGPAADFSPVQKLTLKLILTVVVLGYRFQSDRRRMRMIVAFFARLKSRPATHGQCILGNRGADGIEACAGIEGEFEFGVISP